MTHELKEDTKFNKTVYKKGEKVKIVGDRVNVCVVETIKGEKFAVQVKLIDRIKL